MIALLLRRDKIDHTLKNIIHDLEHGMFGRGKKLSLNYKR